MKHGIAETARIDSLDGARPDLGEPMADLLSRHAAIELVTRGMSVVYAIRMPGGAIKIGVTTNLANRVRTLHGQILAFMPGDHADEQAIHQRLRPFRAYGNEFYRPQAREVWAEVNVIRDHLGLSHLAA